VSDYRIGLRIEDITDDLGNQFTGIVDSYGRKYTVHSFDMRREHHLPWETNYYPFGRPYPPTKWDLNLGLMECPAEEPPTPPKRRSLLDLGLRRPK